VALCCFIFSLGIASCLLFQYVTPDRALTHSESRRLVDTGKTVQVTSFRDLGTLYSDSIPIQFPSKGGGTYFWEQDMKKMIGKFVHIQPSYKIDGDSLIILPHKSWKIIGYSSEQ